MGDRPELRFEEGHRVQCRTGRGDGDEAWSSGTIVKLWYREPNWPRGRSAPYQIKLDDGRLIFAPLDDDRVIKALTGLLADGKIPVTILTGFLGAGKTTLLNYILRANHGKKYAIIENEIGAVGVDNQLLASAPGFKQTTEETITLLDNGCLCCTVRSDLVTAIRSIVETAKKKAAEAQEAGTDCRPLDGIIIETTGMADPGPICKTFYGDPFVSCYCKIDGVITVVDAVHFIEQLTRDRSEGSVNESAQQVGFADKVLLNKVDAVDPDKLERTMEAVSGVNQFVPVTQCSLGRTPEAIPLADLLSINAFDLSKMQETADIDLSMCGEAQKEDSGHGNGNDSGHGAGHGDTHGDGHDCTDACEHGHADSEGHGSGHGHGHGHEKIKFRHDTGVGSFVCEVVGAPIDEMAFRTWMQTLLEQSEDLYRFKGILAMTNAHTGVVMRRVLQGVHDLVDMSEGDAWPTDLPIKSQVVLIGRRLDRAKYVDSFKQCAAE